MKQLATFFALLAVFFLTTSTHSTAVVDACQYFKRAKSEDEAAFFDIFVPFFKKLRADVPLSPRESHVHLKLMHNLASNFKEDAKKHAHVLINHLHTSPKLPPPPAATPPSSHRSSSRDSKASQHTTKAPLAQPAAKVIKPKLAPPRIAAASVRKQTISKSKNIELDPYAQVIKWEDPEDRGATATEKCRARNTELQIALDHLERHINLPEALEALEVWKEFNKHLKQRDLATQCVQKMRALEFAITKLLEKQTLLDKTSNPLLKYLYKIRQSIQRLTQEMRARLRLPKEKPALREQVLTPEMRVHLGLPPKKPVHRTQRNSAPTLRAEIPAPRPIPPFPHEPKKTERSQIPPLLLAARPKSILKNPSQRKGQSGASRGTQATRFTSDTKMITARFTYPQYWSDYLNGTERCSYSAPQFKKDKSGKWNRNAVVPLRSIIGSPGGNFKEGLSFEDAENCHCWIQWAFPTMRKNDYNSFAKTSDPSVLNALQATPALYKALFNAFQYYLAFMGLSIKVGSDGMFSNPSRIRFEQEEDYSNRIQNILQHQHNFLRITQVITSLREHGLSNLSTAFCSYLTNTLPQLDANFKKVSQSSKRYWINAARAH